MDFTKQSDLNKEENLIKMASSGDLDAFNQLVLIYQDLAYHHAHALLRDATLAQDAAQDSFIRGFQNIAGFRGGSFRAWILQLVTNSVYEVLRRSKRYSIQSLFAEDNNWDETESSAWHTDRTASVEDLEEKAEFSAGLYQLLNELPEVYRTTLMLIDMYELDHIEAAQVLKIPIRTVKSRLARARLRMSLKLRTAKNRQLCLYRPT